MLAWYLSEVEMNCDIFTIDMLSRNVLATYATTEHRQLKENENLYIHIIEERRQATDNTTKIGYWI